MLKTERFFKIALMAVMTCVITLFVANAVGQTQPETIGAQDVKTVLFKDANIAMKAAKTAQADVLAPKNFSEAVKYYQKAEEQLQKGKDLENIRENLRESIACFQKAIDATKLAEVAFPNSIKARNDAQYTESARFSSKLWTEAEKKFNKAADELEDGDVNNARKRAGEAEKLYRQAELDAIKTHYLQETRALLKEAEQLDVKDRAPKTLLSAQKLIAQAEKELNENRYDTDVARSLARQANYQAKHAIYLANAIKQMKDKDQSWEDLMLASEIPLQQIADKTNQVSSFDVGYGKTTNDILNYVYYAQNRITGLSKDLDWSLQESNLQRARIVEMEQQLGSQAKEKSLLAYQIADQTKARKAFADVERSFTREEANVLREGNDIIIRLVGLNFPSAAATIEQKSFGLLTKVRDAIISYPECTVSVQGHTDSHGGDEKNLQLSKERAESVQQYLLANSNLMASQTEATGYGESKPIASNETAEGRAANRRVEVVIHPEPVKIVLSAR